MKANTMFLKPDREFSRGITDAIAAGHLSACEMTLRSGEYLFREGEKSDFTYYISKGLLRLFVANDEGTSKTVFFHKSGTLIGFQWFREDTHSLFSAQATTNCVMQRIPAHEFASLIRQDSSLCFNMAKYLFDMLSLQSWESINASLYSVLERFATLMILLAEEKGGDEGEEDPIYIPYGNEDFAEMLGVHRNSISNSIKSLMGSDCLERHRGGLMITDIEKLKRVAGGML